MSNAASDYNGFGFAVAHEYIKENFNEQAKQEVKIISCNRDLDDTMFSWHLVSVLGLTAVSM